MYTVMELLYVCHYISKKYVGICDMKLMDVEILANGMNLLKSGDGTNISHLTR